MKLYRIYIPIVVFLLFIPFCPGCKDCHIFPWSIQKDRDIRSISFWGQTWKTVDVTKRIYEAPDKLVFEINKENERDGFSERPVAARPIPEFSLAMASLMDKMPQSLKTILDQRLIGVFCIKGLGSTGYTEVVFDESGHESYGIVVLDVDVLRERKANDWATWKEGSFFKKTGQNGMQAKVVIEEPQNNTVANAVRYILLHEIGHVLGAVTGSHPSWLDWQSGKKLNLNYPFTALSWKRSEQGDIVSLFDNQFPERKLVMAYSFNRSALPDTQFKYIYDELKQTNFPSLAAAQNLWEDFTESFTTYFHTVIDKRPWRVVFNGKGRQEILFAHCWNENRCGAKNDLIRAWIDDPFSFGMSNNRK